MAIPKNAWSKPVIRKLDVSRERLLELFPDHKDRILELFPDDADENHDPSKHGSERDAA
jgi:hypothetical protein